MNLKLVIEDSNDKCVNATIYSTDTNANIGTLWVTRKELDAIINALTYGMDDGYVLDIEDKTIEY